MHQSATPPSSPTSASSRVALAPEASVPSFGLRDLLTEVFYNFRLIVTGFLVPFVGAIAYSITLAPTYESNARLLVLMSREHMMQEQMGTAGFGLGLDSQSRIVQAEAQILRGRGLRERVMAAAGPLRVYPRLADRAEDPDGPDVATLAAERLAEDFSLQLVPGSDVIALGFTHRDPDIARDVLSTVIETYFSARQDIFTDVAGDLLSRELAGFETELAGIDSEVRALQQAAGVSDFSAHREALVGHVAGLQQAQREAAIEVDSLTARIAEMEDLLSRVPAETDLFVEDDSTSAVNNALDEARRLALERARLGEVFAEGSRTLREIDARLAQARAQVEALRAVSIDRERTGRNTVYDQIQREIIGLRGQLSGLQAGESARATAIADARAELDLLDQVESTYELLLRRRAVLEANYRSYAERLGQERIAQAVERTFEDPTIRVIEPPTVPVEGSSPRLQVAIVGVLGGIATSLMLAYVAISGRAVMVTPQEAERQLRLPVLVAVNQKPETAPGMVSMFTEMSRLFFVLNPPLMKDRCLTIQFLGASHNEGVSCLAREFALVLAQHATGDVLLLDLHWQREPQLESFLEEHYASRFGKPGTPEQLGIDAGNIWRMATPHLGEIETRPRIDIHRLGTSNLLVNNLDPRMRDPRFTPQVDQSSTFWDSLHGRVRAAVIDSPPLSSNFDGLAICRHVDSTILVVSAEQTRRPVAETLRDQVRASDGHVAGLVMNRRQMYIPRIIYRLL